MIELPILTYHRVQAGTSGPPDEGTVALRTFEQQMRHLRRHRYHTATLREALDAAEGRCRFPRRSVVLTFDDATADHWLLVFPILRSQGLRATFFVPTAAPGEGAPRPLPGEGDAAARPAAGPALPEPMAWAELAEVARGGLVDVESHSHRHDRRISGPRIADFRASDESLPGDWGDLRYEDAPALTGPRYFPDPAEAEEVRGWVARQDGGELFRRTHWRQDLRDVITRHRERFGERGHFETREEFLARVEADLRRSRELIRERLGRSTRFLAWPYGAATPEIHALALRIGFAATLVSDRLTIPCPPRLLQRQHFGEDYRGPLRHQVHYWRFVQTLERTLGIGWRRHLAPAARCLVRPWSAPRGPARHGDADG